jgi:ATP-dependent RNA helicase DeaD
MSRFGRYSTLRVLPVYGGAPIRRQEYALQRGVHVVVGTPGRVIDLMERRILNLMSVRVVVLDEADRMLDMGFIEDVEYILSKVPRNRQTSLFSATIDQSVMNLCNRYMKNPEKILVSKDEIALTQMNQYYTVVNPHSKFETLCSILHQNRIDRAIIFCNMRSEVSRLADRLHGQGYDARPLHAGFTQSQRDFVVDSFRTGRLKLLVATDVAARGLDIEGVTHVINYDVPTDALIYFHRIGRTARMGREGTAMTLVGYGELTQLDEIRALTKTSIEQMEVDGVISPHL